jgi:hypothetical protein
MEATLDREAFRVWLESLPGDEIAGKAKRCGHCPLAEFLRSQGAPAAWVGLDEWSAMDGEWQPMPRWAEDFVLMIDNERQPQTSIKAADCLRVLAEIHFGS